MIFLGWLIILILVGFHSASLASFQNKICGATGVPSYFRWDSSWYASVAEDGYSFRNDANSNIAFFPLYPLLMREASVVSSLRIGWAGFILSTLFCSLSAAIFYKLLRLDYSEKISFHAVLVWLFFPSAFFLISVYTESLFVFLSLVSFYFARKNRYFPAVAAASLAAVTRPQGILLTLVLIIQYLRANNFNFRVLLKQKRGMIFVIPVFFLGGFLFFNWLSFGTPLAFLAAQKTWGRISRARYRWFLLILTGYLF